MWLPLHHHLATPLGRADVRAHHGIASANYLEQYGLKQIPELLTVGRLGLTREMPWARGEPPPQGSESMRLRAMAMDLEGGKQHLGPVPAEGDDADLVPADV